jgi:hypothetical protein
LHGCGALITACNGDYGPAVENISSQYNIRCCLRKEGEGKMTMVVIMLVAIYIPNCKILWQKKKKFFFFCFAREVEDAQGRVYDDQCCGI